jgi:hypothetical protein
MYIAASYGIEPKVWNKELLAVSHLAVAFAFGLQPQTLNL